MQNPITKERCDACLSKGVVQCTKNKCIHGSGIKSLLGTVENILYRTLKSYKMFDVIICPSRFIKDKLDSDSVLREKTLVLHNFVEITKSEKDLQKEDYILYFGRFSEEKGITTLLEVCKKLKDIKFHFAGSGPLEKEISKISNIELRGFLSGTQLTDEIRKAKLVVFPSECYENCPFTVMETQLCGTPILASNLGGIPELMQNGVSGELFEAGNAEELIKKIDKLWKSPQIIKSYEENCKKVEFDTLEQYTKRMVEIYKNRK